MNAPREESRWETVGSLLLIAAAIALCLFY